MELRAARPRGAPFHPLLFAFNESIYITSTLSSHVLLLYNDTTAQKEGVYCLLPFIRAPTAVGARYSGQTINRKRSLLFMKKAREKKH